MFTGIIEELGIVAAMETRSTGARLRVRCSTVLSDASEGASIADCCLKIAYLRCI